MTLFQFDGAKVQWDDGGTWLCLRAKTPSQAREFCETMEKRLYDAELKEHRERRSLDANAYFWKLAGDLSAKLHISSDEIYKNYIRDIGDNFDIVPVREDRIEHWNKIWCAGHIGRLTEDLGPCRNAKGYHNIRSYIGSSDYDTAQMSRLIELVVDDCKAQGVETLTPEKLAAMKEAWK